MDFEANLGAAMLAESAIIFARQQEHKRSGEALIEDCKTSHPTSFTERRARKTCDSCGAIRSGAELRSAGGHMWICTDKPECAQRAANWVGFARLPGARF